MIEENVYGETVVLYTRANQQEKEVNGLLE